MAQADVPDVLFGSSYGSLERDIALVEEMLLAHLLIDHDGLVSRSLKECAACQALDNLHQQIVLQWMEAGRSEHSAS